MDSSFCLLRRTLGWLDSIPCLLHRTLGWLDSTLCLLHRTLGWLDSTLCLLRRTLGWLDSTLCLLHRTLGWLDSTLCLLHRTLGWLDSTPCLLRRTLGWLDSTPCLLRRTLDWLDSTPCLLRRTLGWLDSTLCLLHRILDWLDSTPCLLRRTLGWLDSTPCLLRRTLGFETCQDQISLQNRFGLSLCIKKAHLIKQPSLLETPSKHASSSGMLCNGYILGFTIGISYSYYMSIGKSPSITIVILRRHRNCVDITFWVMPLPTGLPVSSQRTAIIINSTQQCAANHFYIIILRSWESTSGYNLNVSDSYLKPPPITYTCIVNS